MKKKQLMMVCMLAVLGLSAAACSKNTKEPEVQVHAENNAVHEDCQVTMTDFNVYYDFWYKDGNLAETYLLLDESGMWEVYNEEGMIVSGTLEIDSETNSAMLLKDESGETAALVTIDGTDKMSMTVHNEELMKIQDSSVFYREIDSM